MRHALASGGERPDACAAARLQHLIRAAVAYELIAQPVSRGKPRMIVSGRSLRARRACARRGTRIPKSNLKTLIINKGPAQAQVSRNASLMPFAHQSGHRNEGVSILRALHVKSKALLFRVRPSGIVP